MRKENTHCERNCDRANGSNNVNNQFISSSSNLVIMSYAIHLIQLDFQLNAWSLSLEPNLNFKALNKTQKLVKMEMVPKIFSTNTLK